MNIHIARMKYINTLLDNVTDFFGEFNKDLINKRVRAEVFSIDNSYNVSTKIVEGRVTDITFYEYDITITIKTDDGREHYLSHNNNFEVIK